MSVPAESMPFEALRSGSERVSTFFRLPVSTCLLILVLAAATSIARAELVVFTHGKVVKALSHHVIGDRIEIRLPGGGSYTLDRLLVERIEEDEVPGEAGQPAFQAPPQPPARVEPTQPATSEPPAQQADATESIGAPKEPEEKRPAQEQRRRRRRR